MKQLKKIYTLKEGCEYEKEIPGPYLYSLDISSLKNNKKLIITNIRKIKESKKINKNNKVY